MRRRRQRLIYVALAAPILIMAVALALFAMKDSVVYFFGPTDLIAKQVPAGHVVRLGGLVVEGSIAQLASGGVRFKVMDSETDLMVEYAGILPDLFREGQGIVATGALNASGVFEADQVLAKHDENYMPPEVADMLKEQGHWQDDLGQDQAGQGEGGAAKY